jgi:Uma2 family endonuclease
MRSQPVLREHLEAVEYPESDDMGEGELQRFVSEVLRQLLERFLAERGDVAHVGANTFIYWIEGNPSRATAPDVYVLGGVPQDQLAGSWKLWELDAPPLFALEIVSRDIGKDYTKAPMLHAELGTRELVVFDPEARGHRDRVLWQVWRRGDDDLVPVHRTDEDRIMCSSLGCWLRTIGEGTAMRVRIATGPDGEDLFPTDHERAEQERAARVRLEVELAALRAKSNE